ncbi:MAG TPA: hypothetical protein VFS68_10055, partial [Candidatus Udaeobacter sp.]|nr:hypothetical protein [Candidatus Udaeobacter sp.]
MAISIKGLRLRDFPRSTMTLEQNEFERGDSESEIEINRKSSVLSNGTVVISLASRYSGTFWYAGGAFGLGSCVELDEPVDHDAP